MPYLSEWMSYQTQGRNILTQRIGFDQLYAIQT